MSGRRIADLRNKIEKDKYTLRDAVSLLKECAVAKFVESVDIDLRFDMSSTKSKVGLSGTVDLPHGNGKSAKIMVFAQGEYAQKARDADYIGSEDWILKIKEGYKVDFDWCIATPDMMSKVGKLGKFLRKLMPNPKMGTVTFDVASKIAEIREGSIAVHMDKNGLVHSRVGSVEFSDDKLSENVSSFVESMLRMTDHQLVSSYISSTMGPSIPFDHRSVSEGR